MGKKLFFLSLILLSISMGLHWNKNKPKVATPKPHRRTAVNLEDLTLQDESIETEEKLEDEIDQLGEDDINEIEDNESNTDDEVDQERPASSTLNINENLSPDLIIASLLKMKRNPFEISPYAQLIVESQKKEELANMPIKKKEVKVLAANFSATIRTNKELVAIIDSRLYRKGEIFNGMKILEIKTEFIALKSGNISYVLPKRGVQVSIAKDGSYTVVDEFHKNELIHSE